MIEAVKIFLARESFKNVRTKVYEILAREMLDTGGGKKELLPDKFERWAKRDRQRNDLVWIAYAAIAKKLRGGKALSGALAGFVPREEQIVIAAGENLGNLGATLQSVVRQDQVMRKVISATSGALFEPGVTAIGFFATSVMFGKMIWPILEKSFPEKYWDIWTVPLRVGQTWVAQWWLPTLMAMAGLVFLVLWSRSVFTGRARTLFDHLPPWSSYRDQMAVKTLVMLGQLCAAKKTVKEALDIVAKTSPRYLRWHLVTMRKRLNKPNVRVEQVFGTGLFNQGVVDMIADASQGRDFDEVLKAIADSMLEDIVTSIERRARVMNLVALGAVLSLFFYATIVQVIGVQNTSDRYTSALTSGKR